MTRFAIVLITMEANGDTCAYDTEVSIIGVLTDKEEAEKKCVEMEAIYDGVYSGAMCSCIELPNDDEIWDMRGQIKFEQPAKVYRFS